MSERERLIRLLDDKIYSLKITGGNEFWHSERINALADSLLENGVIVPPCKVWDKTYLLLERVHDGGYDIYESKCVRITDNGYGVNYSMYFDCAEIDNTLEFGICDFGKSVFLTREDAEKALAERCE